MTYAPRPLNQFNRLVYVSGNRATGTYALGSAWNNIRYNRDWDSANCTAAVGAMAVDASTGGARRTGPPDIRNAQNDWSGGIGLDDVNVAIGKLFPGHQLTLSRYGAYMDWADVLYRLKQGRFVAIQGDYDQVPYNYQAQKGGTFDHAFGLGGYRTSDGRVLYYDPLARHGVWVPQYAIRPAAEKLALVQRGDRHKLFAGYTRVMPTILPPTTTYRVSVRAGDVWSYRLSSGVIVGRSSFTTGGFSASCTAPRIYSARGLPSARYTLVRLTSGSRSGKYIAARYAEET